ncbi:MAG: HAMP domain-containing sensor histidine kinase [Coriobacteriia bacterium]|nr:HAMP domain-containing sensor histidine kinase [Coriobacteriia bacterium]
MRQRARMQRISEGLGELARGNYAHRVILPGDDDASRMAEQINRLADEIQKEREAAGARDASRRQLLANISHDLRTPITSIAGYVDALQRGLGDEPGRYLAVLAQKTTELAQLTDDLFYSARIDAGDLELKSQRLDLAEAVRRSVLGFEPQLTATDVRVDVSLPDGACVVEADPSALSRILSNLVSNALKHGEGMIAFSVEMSERDGAYAVCMGHDGGRLPDDVDRLFERGVAGPSGGTGLGLSIARELAERMGASVTLAGARAGGAESTLTFPKPDGS